ncbi:MAG: TolB-like protein [Desulforhopalus sp.]|jgi:TolB-like protein
MRLFVIFIICISFTQTAVGQIFAADADKNHKLIFATFDDRSAKKYAYLRDSIQTMLMSRLSSNENIEVIDRVLSKKELATLAQKSPEAKTPALGEADYLVTGGIYALANGINVQVTMYPFDSSQKVLNFSKISEQATDIIAGNDILIATILQELIGDPVDVEGAVAINSQVSGFTTVHPEAEYKKGLYSGTIVESELHGIEAKANGIKKSLSVAGEIIACTVGDLDANGIDELVSLTASTIDIYQSRERKIVKVAELKLPNGLRGHGLNIADIDNDGKFEVYISATQDLRVASIILGWSEEGGFQTLAKNVRWYLRPIHSNAKGWQLAGQKRGLAKVDFVGKGVFLLSLDANFKITEKSRLPIPDGVNLFDFTYAELDGEKGEELVVLDSNEKLRVISKDNELLWVSSSTFGGSKTYIGPSQGSAVDRHSKSNLTVDEDADRELIFVPARILVTDVDNDGLSEIVVNKNESGALGFFKRLRSYDGGAVVGLAWNGSELTEAWRTGRYKGYVVDYFFQKTDTPVTEEAVSTSLPTTSGRLYVANMPHSGSIVGLLPGVSDTKLTIYELDFYKQKQPDNNQ